MVSTKKVISFIILGFCLWLVSCQVSFNSSSDLDNVGYNSYPLAEAETTFNSLPVTDIECNHFVAPNGDDDNPGSEKEPWGSFQWAASKANPGDTVCFHDGTYISEDIHIVKSGNPDAMITFAAYPGENPFLDGNGSANVLIVLDRGVENIRISGFSLRNFRIWGILLTGENRHIHLDHLDIAGGEASLRLTYANSAEEPPVEGIVENVLVEDSLIHGSQYSAVDCTPGPCNYVSLRRLEVFNTGLTGDAFYGSDGIEFARGHHLLVEDCYVHDNGGDGIDLGSRDREGHIEGVIVQRNHVVRNHLNGIKVWAGGRIENNVIWDSGDSAIWSGSFDCVIEIINNSVAYNMWDPDYSGRNWAVVIGYPEEKPKPKVNLVLINNIFAFNADPLEGGPTGVYLGPGVQIVEEGSNIFYSNSEEEITVDVGDGRGFSREDIASGAWASFSGKGQEDITYDPMFVSGWPDVDLHLDPDSPGIDAGSTIFAPDLDILLTPRADNPDIGAYEQ